MAITTGDPVDPPAELASTIEPFVAFCNAENWTPCLYSTTEADKQITDGLGWAGLQVAEETVLPLGALVFTGKKFQDIRTLISRAAKNGITAEWLSYPDAPLAIRDQIQAISEEWVADKALPEMGFGLGGLEELDDPAVRCLIAIDGDRTCRGITSRMPCHRDGRPVGWTLDFMRRRAEGFKGVMEFLIGTAAWTCKRTARNSSASPGHRSRRPTRERNTRACSGCSRWSAGGWSRCQVPVLGALQGQVETAVPADVPVLSRVRGAAQDRVGISHAYLPTMTFGQAIRMMGQLT